MSLRESILGLVGLNGSRRVGRVKSERRWSLSTVTSAEAMPRPAAAAASAQTLIARATQYVLICAALNAEVAASMRLRMYRREGAGAGRARRVDRIEMRRLRDQAIAGKAVEYADDADTIEEVIDHPVLDLLRRPNPWQTGRELFQALYLHRELAGQSFAYVSLDGGSPELYALLPQYVRIQPSRESFIAGYWYGRGAGREEFFRADEVMHVRHSPSPFDPYGGIGPLHAVLRESELQAMATDAEIARWINGGRPDYIVSLPREATDDQMQQAEARLVSSHRGPRNAGRWIVLRDDVRVQPAALGNRDMQYVEGQDRVQRMIWDAFGVPESVLRPNEGSLAAARVGHPGYLARTIVPRLIRWADAINETLLPMLGYEPGEVWVVYDDPVPADREYDLRRAQTLYSAGLITRNEARGMIGLDSIEGGDVLAPSASPVTPPPPIEDVRSIPAVSTAAAPRLKQAIPAVVERRFAEQLAAYLRDMSSRARVSDDARVLLDLDAERLDRIIDRHVSELIRIGAVEVAGRMGRDESMFVPSLEGALEFLRDYRIQLARRISQTMEEDLRGVIADGLARGQTIAEITPRVQEVLRETAAWRAERIAATESVRALGAGRVGEMRAAGVRQKQWLLSSEPCPACVALVKRTKGGIVGVDDPYLRVGESMLLDDGGVFTNSYMDVHHEPLHPYCRCTVAPVL